MKTHKRRREKNVCSKVVYTRAPECIRSLFRAARICQLAATSSHLDTSLLTARTLCASFVYRASLLPAIWREWAREANFILVFRFSFFSLLHVYTYTHSGSLFILRYFVDALPSLFPRLFVFLHRFTLFLVSQLRSLYILPIFSLWVIDASRTIWRWERNYFAR